MSLDDRLPAALHQADSPFLPGTSIQFAWDSVSLTGILSCPRRYQLDIILGYRPRSTSVAIALSFGILFHHGLEYYHKARFAGLDHFEATKSSLADVFAHKLIHDLPTDEENDEAAAAHDEDEDDGVHLRNSKVRTRYYLARAIVWYLEHYGADDTCRTVALPSGAPAVEVSFRIPLPVEIGNDEEQLTLCGHMDRAVDFQGSLFPSDYKTSKGLTRQFFEMFDLSHQMTGYFIAGNVIFGGDRTASGIMIDGVALQVGGVKLGRGFTRRTPGQLAEYFRLLRYAADLAQRLATQHEGDYPMNTAACYFCQYKSVCRQPPEFRQRYLDLNFEAGHGWNPLQNR